MEIIRLGQAGAAGRDKAEKPCHEKGQQALPLVHRPLEVEGRSRQQHVDRVADNPLER